jgi:hypothetical protein
MSNYVFYSYADKFYVNSIPTPENQGGVCPAYEYASIYNGYLYLSDFNWGNIDKLNLINPSTDFTRGPYSGIPGPSGSVIYGNYLYVCQGSQNYNNGLPANVFSIQKINLNNLNDSSIFFTTTDIGYFNSLDISNGYIYVSSGYEASISKISLTNPTTDYVINWVMFPNNTANPIGIKIYGEFIYAADSGNNIIRRVSLIDPSGNSDFNWMIGNGPTAMEIVNGYIYVANYYGGNIITKINLANPEIDSEYAWYAVGSTSVVSYGTNLYALDSDHQLIYSIPLNITPLYCLYITPLRITDTAIYLDPKYKNPYYFSSTTIESINSDILIGYSNWYDGFIPIYFRNRLLVNYFSLSNINIPDSWCPFVIYYYNGSNYSGTLSTVINPNLATLPVSSYSGTNGFQVNKITFLVGGNATVEQVTLNFYNPAGNIFYTGNTVNSVNFEGCITNNWKIYRPDFKNNIISKFDLLDICGNVHNWAVTVNGPTGLAVSDGYLYVSNTNDHVISKINLANPSGNSINQYWALTGINPVGLATYNGYIYAANYGNNTISRINLTDPYNDISQNWVTVGPKPKYLYVKNNYMYITNDNNSVTRMSLSNPWGDISLNWTRTGIYNQFALHTGIPFKSIVYKPNNYQNINVSIL